MSNIVIQGLEFNDNKITNRLTVSNNLKKYVNSYELFVEYDNQIYADESILNIPLIATIIPLAWLTGSNITVESIDSTFKESMEDLQLYFKDIYPLIPFTTEIKAKKIIENNNDIEDSKKRTGLLFSGGVDATYSMITNLQYEPRLIMHWGVEGKPYPFYQKYWKLVTETYSRFADRFGLPFNIVKTNVLTILNRRRLEHRYSKELLYGSLWVRLQHSLVLLGLTAPLSIKRFDRLLIAASEWPRSIETQDSKNRPHAARPESDERIKWSNLRVIHDGYIERYKKAKSLAEYFKDDELILRVCLNRKAAPHTLNCNQCEKCCRTIVQLIQAGIDPNQCGFKVNDSSSFDTMIHYYTHHGLDSYAVNSKEIIPNALNSDIYGSKHYFEWLQDFEVPEREQSLFFRDIYDTLPYLLATKLDILYEIFGINIHFGNPKLPKNRLEKINKINQVNEKRGPAFIEEHAYVKSIEAMKNNKT